MTQNTIVFFFPVCSICSASDGDCDWCEGTGFDPLPGHALAPQVTIGGDTWSLEPIAVRRPTTPEDSGVFVRGETGIPVPETKAAAA